MPSVIPHRASCLFEHSIHFWECAHERLAISEKVTVIIDEYRYSELFRKERAHCYAASETWEVWQITDYACLVVCRSGKSETDCRRFLLKQLLFNGLKSGHQCIQTTDNIIIYRIQPDGGYDFTASSDSRKDEVRPPGIQCHYYSVVILAHSIILYA